MSVGLDVAALRGERILDIGCDTGVFLKAAQEECGVVPFGIDVAERAVEVARARGIQVWRAAVEDAPPELGEFPVITAIDLLEHVPDPHAFLRAVWSRLRPGGVLYLETPNICSAVFRFGRLLSLLTAGRPASLLERLFPPQHIQLFTPGSLRALAGRSEFEVLDLRPRILPSPDIAASAAARLAIGTLQLFDRLQGTQILICAVLRRPGGKL
ncbi:MAG: class I SAM-dependent methyltransferase [Acidobacteria bacterium]|nr:class I SAM-dependent methyltransferase [Acidobacteriota bacterium]